MTLTPEARARLVEALSEIHRDIQAARGLFRLDIGGQPYELPVEGCVWHPVPGIDGVEMCPLPVAHWPEGAPPHTDYFAARGPQGARPPERVRVPQAVRVEVLHGTVLFWTERAPAYVPYQAGDVLELLPGEAHTYLAQTDFFNRVGFSPRITQP